VTKTKSKLYKVAVEGVINCSAISKRLAVVQWSPVKPKAAENPLDDEFGPAWALLKLSVPGIVTWSCSASTDEDVPPELKASFTFTGIFIGFGQFTYSKFRFDQPLYRHLHIETIYNYNFCLSFAVSLVV